MRYAVLGDIHANLEALNAVCGALEGENIDKYLCVGDLAGYGADPVACIRKMRQLKAVTVAGNHDWAAADKIDIDDFNDYARDAVLWTRETITEADKDFLGFLELIYRSEDFVMVHGTLTAAEDFDYMTDFFKAARTLAAMTVQLCFLGHSHVAGTFFERKGKIEYDTNSAFKIEPDNKYVINVGSVGQPRDGNPQAAYCIYDTRSQNIEIRRVSYDVKTAQKKILVAGLPELLAARLEEGR